MPMKRLLRLLPALLLLATPSLAHAYDFAIDGIYYNITSDTEVDVIRNSSDKYTGDVTIPATIAYDGITYLVTGIGDSAFYKCTSLTSVSIPDAVTTIGTHAFYDCDGLTEVEIPDAVTTIGKYAFCSCSNLTEITIPDAVISLGYEAFNGCSNVTTLIIGSSVEDIAEYVFAGCTSITDIYCCNTSAPTCKSAYSYSSVSGVSLYAFSQVTYNHATLHVPEGCESEYTSDSAWGNFVNITGDINIGEEFYANTFYYRVIGINKVELYDAISQSGSKSIPETIEYDNEEYKVVGIGDSAFYAHTALTGITIPSSVKYIGNYAFNYCYSLTSIDIPGSVRSIGSYAFDHCIVITSFQLNEGLSEVGAAAFANCYKLTGISIPTTLTSLSDSIFFNNSTLESVEFEGNISNIGDYAFYNSGIQEIALNPGLTSIGTYAFAFCSSLTDVELEEGLLTVGSMAFFFCTSLETLALPESVTSLGNNTFYYCKNLTNINIPSGVTYLSYNNFMNCSSLTSITIPSGVTGMGTGVFYGCTSLTDVYCLRTTAPSCYVSSSYPDTFSESTYSDATLHVPSGSSSSYESATTWKKFTNIVEDATAVTSVSADGEEAQPTGYYSLSGQRIDAPVEGAVTIIRYSDGTAKKVFMK